MLLCGWFPPAGLTALASSAVFGGGLVENPALAPPGSVEISAFWGETELPPALEADSK